MTTEEIEDVVRALNTAVENLEAGGARQSMQEAFVQLCAYVSSARTSSERNRRGNDRPEPRIFVSDGCRPLAWNAAKSARGDLLERVVAANEPRRPRYGDNCGQSNSHSTAEWMVLPPSEAG